MSKKITASFKVGKSEMTGVPVVNPGDWFGKAWHLSLPCSNAGGHSFIVEADSASDAEMEFSDSEYGHLIHVSEADLKDYPEESRQHDDSGRVIDTEELGIEGEDGAKCPFQCLYHGEGLPKGGITPLDYSALQDADEAVQAYIAALPGGLYHQNRTNPVSCIIETWEEAKRAGYALGQTKAFEFINKETGGNVHQVPQLLKELAAFCWSSEGNSVDLYLRCIEFVKNAHALRDPRCHIVWNMEGDTRVPTFTWHFLSEDGKALREEAKRIEDCPEGTRFTFERQLEEESK
jgi:hypothetical protein